MKAEKMDIKKGPRYAPLSIDSENALTPGYRNSMEVQGFKFVRNADKSDGLKGGQIYKSLTGEEYLLKAEDLIKDAAAVLYKKSKSGEWVKMQDMDIFPMK